jgi:hypothetical protein
MKFSVVALDYDGTIAWEGVLDPEVRAAIAEVRAQGITVVIVSGRGLSDLKQAAGVSVGEGQGFVFTCNGKPVKPPARTLREFVSALASLPPEVLAGHANGGDFSRWILDVFRDHPLSSRVRKLEEQYRLGHIRDLGHPLATLIRERYDLPSNINVPG